MQAQPLMDRALIESTLLALVCEAQDLGALLRKIKPLYLHAGLSLDQREALEARWEHFRDHVRAQSPEHSRPGKPRGT